MRYVPDSHNSRSFLSRLMSPAGWAVQFWGAWLLWLIAMLWTLATLLVDGARTTEADLLYVKTRIASHQVTEGHWDLHHIRSASHVPRSVLLTPAWRMRS